MYLHRHIEQKLIEISQYFKIVLIKGARQVGKSTLLEHLFPNMKRIVFDPIQDNYGARRDPDLFLDNFPAPLILDEIQYAPELLPALKRRADLSQQNGQYFLTGSQNLSVLKSVAESLAGRVGILELDPMSVFEISQKTNHWLSTYLNEPQHFNHNSVTSTLSPDKTLFELIWRGGFPGTLALPDHLFANYFESYLQTYIERDIRLLENIQDLPLFERFVSIVASLTAQEINNTELGREIGVSHTTANRWLNVLQHSYQWREIWPYHGNTIKRISKKPKGYFVDTGFACYLQRISSSDGLAHSRNLGALFESYCVNLIIQLLSGEQLKPHLYHWRSSGGAEVDLILEQDGKLFPIEMKCKTVLSQQDTRGIRAFKETYPKENIQMGIILYAGKESFQLNEQCIALPWDAI